MSRLLRLLAGPRAAQRVHRLMILGYAFLAVAVALLVIEFFVVDARDFGRLLPVAVISFLAATATLSVHHHLQRTGWYAVRDAPPEPDAQPAEPPAEPPRDEEAS